MSFDIDKLRIGVIGLGYVGLPLAVEFGKQYSTTGFDVNDARIAELRDGIDSTLEVSGGELASVKQLEFTSRAENLEDCCNFYVVTVPTPVGDDNRPILTPLFLFTKNILAGKPIDVFNYGKHRRDFTYVDDIVEGVIRTLDHTATANPDWDPADPDPGTSDAPYRIYNIGNQRPVELMRYIEVIEECLGMTAEKNMLPLQPGDVPDTYADASDLANDVGYRPDTSIEVGISNFIDWYLDYYKPDHKLRA